MDNTSETTHYTQIQKLWDLAVEYGINVRASGTDGREGWLKFQEINRELINSITTTFQTTSVIKNFVTVHYEVDPSDAKCRLIFREGSIQYVLRNDVETEHFIVQAARICHNEKHTLSPTKVSQLGYNHGQYLGAQQVNPSTYHTDVIKFYSKNKLNEMKSYIL
jgi:hypothetical protein